MAQSSITIQLDPAVQDQLTALADARHQDVSEVAAEVIASYVAVDSWERRHIRASLAELESGESVADERVMEWLDSWGTENELPAPK